MAETFSLQMFLQQKRRCRSATSKQREDIRVTGAERGAGKLLEVIRDRREWGGGGSCPRREEVAEINSTDSTKTRAVKTYILG